ncbi:ribosome biosynthesis protein nip7 [Naganishia onofrii]|uniref:Ribosome biosynthesis protein nip7 n=1 Tax=Naganishia onofrii TaxID=1851511 RepID=A0ACC2XXI3_9TREE|nr:ribosome biosynthesis protein nip7 [Naganishia onofrii]
MRPLTEEETKAVFEKLANYIGKNLVHLIDRPEEDAHCFRLHKDRVYYLPVKTMHLATSISRPNLISLGTCFGKFSKSGKFKLTITSLDWLAKYAKYKVSAFSRTGSPLGFGQSRKPNGNAGSGADMAEMNTARRSS